MATTIPESLVKYCSVDSARALLSSQSLRWSAPSLFLDPFELNHKTPLSFDPQTILGAAIQAANAMIFAKEDPRGSSPLAVVIRRWRDEERFHSPEEALEVLRELLSKMVDQRLATLDSLMTDWRSYCRSLRICSFSARPDNMACWTHFADHHRGVAIKFQCGEFSALPKPEPVQYKPARPEITTLREQLDVVLTNQPFSAQEFFQDKFTSKSPHFAAENEWRCFRQQKDDGNKPEEQWYEDVKFERADITAVYFGAYTDARHMREIYGIVQEKYSQAKVFQAVAAPGKYEIVFNRLTK